MCTVYTLALPEREFIIENWHKIQVLHVSLRHGAWNLRSGKLKMTAEDQTNAEEQMHFI